MLHISRDKWINFLSTVLNLFTIRCVIAVIWQYLNTAVMISLLLQFGCVFLWSGIIATNANSLQGSNASETVVKSVQKRWLPRYPYNSEFAVSPRHLSGPDGYDNIFVFLACRSCGNSTGAKGPQCILFVERGGQLLLSVLRSCTRTGASALCYGNFYRQGDTVDL